MNYISIKLTKYDIFHSMTNYFKVELLALSQQILTFMSLKSHEGEETEIG